LSLRTQVKELKIKIDSVFTVTGSNEALTSIVNRMSDTLKTSIVTLAFRAFAQYVFDDLIHSDSETHSINHPDCKPIPRLGFCKNKINDSPAFVQESFVQSSNHKPIIPVRRYSVSKSKSMNMVKIPKPSNLFDINIRRCIVEKDNVSHVKAFDELSPGCRTVENWNFMIQCLIACGKHVTTNIERCFAYKINSYLIETLH